MKYARKKRRFSEFEACLDLIERAAFATYPKDANGVTITIPRGHVIASVRLYADRWCWPQTNAQRFFKRLERDGDAERVAGTPIGTLYCLTWYELDQSHGTGTGTANGTETVQRRNDNKKESTQERLLEEKSSADKPRSPRTRKAVRSEEPQPSTAEQPTASGGHWLAPSAAVYAERTGGVFPWGKAGRQLIDLRDTHSPETIAAHMGVWLLKQLADADARGKTPYLGFDDFAATFGLHEPEAEPELERGPSVAEQMAAAGIGNAQGQVFSTAFPPCTGQRDPRLAALGAHWRKAKGAGVTDGDIFQVLGPYLSDYPPDTLERAIDTFVAEGVAQGKPQFYTWKGFARRVGELARAAEACDLDDPEIGPILAESWGGERCAQIRAHHAKHIRGGGWTVPASIVWDLAQRHGLAAYDGNGEAFAACVATATADPQAENLVVRARLRIYLESARVWELAGMTSTHAVREIAERLALAYRRDHRFYRVADNEPERSHVSEGAGV